MEAPLTGETGANDPAIGYNIWPRWMPGHRASEMHFSISRLTANNPLKGFCHNAIGQFNVVCDMQGCLARRTGPDVSASAHLGYASAGRAAMLGDLSAAIPTQNGEPRH